MERQEPRFDKDMKDVEFRPRSYRGPSQPSPSHSSEGYAWKIGVAVGVGVLAALLIFNAYERYQARRDVEEAVRALEQETPSWSARCRPPSARSPFLRPGRSPSFTPSLPATAVLGARCCIATATAGAR